MTTTKDTSPEKSTPQLASRLEQSLFDDAKSKLADIKRYYKQLVDGTATEEDNSRYESDFGLYSGLVELTHYNSGLSEEGKSAFRELEQQFLATVREYHASKPNPSDIAIQFALSTNNGLKFLQLWHDAEFEKVLEGWPDAPSELFIGVQGMEKLISNKEVGHGTALIR